MFTVVTGKTHEIVNLNQYARVIINEFICEGRPTYVVQACPVDKRTGTCVLGEYWHRAIAELEMSGLINAIETGKSFHRMARSLYDSEEIDIKDARVRRRGGS